MRSGTTRFYVINRGADKSSGPTDAETIAAWEKDGYLSPGWQACVSGTKEWKEPSEFTELAAALGIGPPPAPPPPSGPPAAPAAKGAKGRELNLPVAVALIRRAASATPYGDPADGQVLRLNDEKAGELANELMKRVAEGNDPAEAAADIVRGYSEGVAGWQSRKRFHDVVRGRLGVMGWTSAGRRGQDDPQVETDYARQIMGHQDFGDAIRALMAGGTEADRLAPSVVDDVLSVFGVFGGMAPTPAPPASPPPKRERPSAAPPPLPPKPEAPVATHWSPDRTLGWAPGMEGWKPAEEFSNAPPTPDDDEV